MNFQNTKIIATVGPAISEYSKLLQLVHAGVDVFRLNFSHGTHEDHLKIINHIQYINQKYNFHIGLLADLQGPKLRVGDIKGGKLILKAGDEIIFTNKPSEGTRQSVYLSYEKFASDVSIGETVLVDDGKLLFEVIETNQKDTVKLKTIFGGELKPNKGVNLPQTHVSLPCITEKDSKDLDFILQQPINWIALSFVRSANDIKQLKKRIKSKNHPAKIVAKIEKPEAIDNIDKIINRADAIMIARGDLGVEVPMERLPGIQKEVISKCIQAAKPAIVATQMMESMINNPSPTRAEITDVANAVLDGTDAVMLSAETSVGNFPEEVVLAMAKIVEESERNNALLSRIKKPKPNRKSKTFYSDVICFNAAKTADDTHSKAIIGMTKSGYTAFRISSYRPRNKGIFIFSDEHHLLATLNLVWGVRCFYYDKFTTTDETIDDVVRILKENKCVEVGDFVVNTASMPIHKRFRTNTIKLTLIE